MSRWQVAFLRCALFWLLANGAVGIAVALKPAWTGMFAATHAHLGTVGFFLSMVMGVAYWMLPRPGGVRQPRLEAITFTFLQSGMVTRVVAEPWWRATGSDLAHTLFGLSGALVFGAMVTFALAMRTRIVTLESLRAAARPRGSRSRPPEHTRGGDGLAAASAAGSEPDRGGA